ncbi:MAG: methionyl-tRNA formyltransferase [Clostridia bacterium]|nr:methionyl-tRNA formyltransferase [Clostridia bacterium]
MKIIYLGTPNFAVAPLDALIKAGHTIVGVVTKVDKVNARGNKVVFSAVKEYALQHNLPLFQFESIKRQGVEPLKQLNADIMITASFGQILSEELINLCKFGVLNIHGSILPKLRGASPVASSLLNGDKETGVTIMQTGVGLDDGDMLYISKISIDADDNQETLMDKLSKLGADAIVKVLDDIEFYRENAQKQDENLATHCKKILKEEAQLDFSKSANQLNNEIRAFYNNPTAYFKFNETLYKVFKVEVVNQNYSSYGEVVAYDKANGFVVSCGLGAIKIMEIQKQGGKVLGIKDFMNGNKFEVGQKLN